MNHLLNLNVPSALIADIGPFSTLQLILVPVLIGLVVVFFVMRKRGQ